MHSAIFIPNAEIRFALIHLKKSQLLSNCFLLVRENLWLRKLDV